MRYPTYKERKVIKKAYGAFANTNDFKVVESNLNSITAIRVSSGKKVVIDRVNGSVRG